MTASSCSSKSLSILLGLGAQLESSDSPSHPEQAYQIYRQILAHLDPDSLLRTEVRDRKDNVLNCLVSKWHFAMINDSRRNDAYSEAVAQVLNSQTVSRVLDVGTGTTAMLAVFAAAAAAKSTRTNSTVL